jgi:hypothetical protein
VSSFFYSYNFKELDAGKCKSDEEDDLTTRIYELDTSEYAFGIYSLDADDEYAQIGHHLMAAVEADSEDSCCRILDVQEALL